MPGLRGCPVFPVVSRSIGHGRGTERARADGGMRAWQRAPESADYRYRLPTDRNLVDDLAESGGHHDVRGLHGPSLVAVVGPPDVRDQCAFLDAQEGRLLGGGLPWLRLLHSMADGD